jgi:POT family proton-dependent oligopeptide transporter
LVAIGLETRRDRRGRAAAELFGHPRALFHLIVGEAFERFAYFGVQSLVALYLVNRLLAPEGLDQAIGLSPLVSALRATGWDYSPQKFASAVFGLYGGLAYLAPLLGGLTADRLLGPVVTIRLSALLSALGCFLIASETLFFPGLLCLALGAGCFKSNMASQVSSLYSPGDRRRDPAFQLFFIAINVGVIAAPLACGWIGVVWGWSYGFVAAGIGMLAGLTAFVLGEPYLPKVRRDLGTVRTAKGEKSRLAPRRVWGMALLAAPLAMILTGNQQIYNAYLVWAEDAANLTIGPFSAPTSWLVSFDTVCSLLIMTAGLRLQGLRRPRSGTPDELAKIAFGGLLVAASYLALAGAGLASPPPQRADFAWLLAFHLLNGIGFAYVIPTGLALFARLAPPSFPASTLGLFYLTYALANLAAGMLGGLLSEMSAAAFWSLHALLIGASGAAIGVARPLFRRAFAD